MPCYRTDGMDRPDQMGQGWDVVTSGTSLCIMITNISYFVKAYVGKRQLPPLSSVLQWERIICGGAETRKNTLYTNPNFRIVQYITNSAYYIIVL